MPSAFAGLVVLASGGEGASFNPIEVDWKPMVWAWVLFILLFLVLRKFAWKPLLEAVEGREKRIADSLKKAEEIQKAAGEIAARQEATLAEAQARAKSVLDEARAQSEDYRKREIDRAKADSDAFLDRARKEIGLEEARARDALRREVVDLALEVSSRVLERAVTAEDDRRLADKLLAEVQAKRAGAARN